VPGLRISIRTEPVAAMPLPGNDAHPLTYMKKSLLLLFSILVCGGPLRAADAVAGTNAASLYRETMTPARFREIVATPGDALPLVPQLAAVPFWTNAAISNVMTYASGKVYEEALTQTACTVAGKYEVFTVHSRFYKQPMNAILTYDENAQALKVYGLFSDGQGGDIVTCGTAVYDYAKKTYTISSFYGDGFSETTTGSYTDREDFARTVVYKNGFLFMTREARTRPLVSVASHP